MRILLIGDLNSSFVRDYAFNLRKNNSGNLYLDLFATMTPVGSAMFSGFDAIYSYPDSALYRIVKQSRFVIRVLLLMSFFIRRRKRYDHIHILYLPFDFFCLTPVLRFLKVKPIITVFGSDLMRISDSRKRLLAGFIKNSKLITFANPEIRETVCGYYKLDFSQTRICRFGLSPLEFIKELKPTEGEFHRLRLNLPLGKVLICIGYNYNSNQQHQKIIGELSTNTELLKVSDQIHFILPLTYGTEEKNKDEILTRLQKFPFSYNVFTEFLDDTQNAALRLSTDIMIQLQSNDQLSGAMQEHMYAGSVVITGNWLPYQVLRDLDLYFIGIEHVKDIGAALVSCLENLEKEKILCSDNPEQIYRLSSWNNTIKDWESLYAKQRS